MISLLQTNYASCRYRAFWCQVRFRDWAPNEWSSPLQSETCRMSHNSQKKCDTRIIGNEVNKLECWLHRLKGSEHVSTGIGSKPRICLGIVLDLSWTKKLGPNKASQKESNHSSKGIFLARQWLPALDALAWQTWDGWWGTSLGQRWHHLNMARCSAG